MKTTRAMSSLLPCACALAGALVGLAPPLPAQVPPAVDAAPSTPRDPEAEADYQRGVQAFRDRRYGDARAAFEAAVRRQPTPASLFAYAQSCRNSGRYVDAVAAFERYLATPEAPGEAQMRTDVRAELAQLRRSLATLTVEVGPPLASLRIDGRPLAVANGQQTLDPGAHVIEFSADGHHPERREVTLGAGGQLVLHVDLRATAPTHARLVVEPDVATATVLVDGRRVGVGHVELDVPAGDHLLEIQAAGRDSYRRPLHVDGSGTLRIAATLPRRGLPGWVLPVTIGGGLALVGGAIALGFALSSNDAPTLPADLRIIATADGIRVGP